MTDPTPEPEDKTGNLPEDVTKVLEDIKNKLDQKSEETPASSSAVPSYADQRAVMQKRLGLNDEQMAAHEEMLLKSQAPLIENAGWQRIEKKSDIETYRKEVEQELQIYPQEKRTPEVMEKIYFMVKGRHADSRPPDPPTPPGKVVDTRVIRGPGYSGAEPGLPAGGGGEPAEEELTDVEKFVVSKLKEGGVAITEQDYRKSKAAGKSIRELRVPDQRPVNSMADIELRRLIGTR